MMLSNPKEYGRLLQTVLILAVVFAAGFFLGSHSGTTAAQSIAAPAPDTEKFFEPFWEVFNLIQSDYVDPNDQPVEIQSLVNGAISGMVDSLGDQFSGYMDPETYPMMSDDLSGEIEGIGVVIRTNEETQEIEVVSILEGTPAANAGLRPGDVFAAVDGEDVTQDNQLELATKVRGPAGTTVNLTMRRDDELLEFSIKRERIVVPNIEARVLENTDIAYVRLQQFLPEARSQIDAAVAELDVNSRLGLILDLRGNPGGLLNSAIDVTSAFVRDGTILIEDFGDANEQVFDATGNFLNVSVPIVVLVDETSASASEIVAGALQDRGIAKIVGEVTLGKGTVQMWRELVNGGGLRLTIARWLTPNRNWIHDQGITPDIIVEWTPESFDDPNDPQLAAALEHLRMVSGVAQEQVQQ